MITDWEARLFDEKFDGVWRALPPALHRRMDEVHVVIEDEPDPALLRSMGMDPGQDDLCGLHTGVALTERSIEAPGELPDQIMLFRGPILRLAQANVPGTGRDAVAELTRQIRITLLHEIGHHFGLDEDDLDRLGYA